MDKPASSNSTISWTPYCLSKTIMPRRSRSTRLLPKTSRWAWEGVLQEYKRTRLHRFHLLNKHMERLLTIETQRGWDKEAYQTNNFQCRRTKMCLVQIYKLFKTASSKCNFNRTVCRIIHSLNSQTNPWIEIHYNHPCRTCRSWATATSA